MVDSKRNVGKKQSPFRLGQHNTVLKGKKGVKDRTAAARSNK